MEIKKILLTGGAGFISSHLLDFLVKKGYDIVVLEKKNTNTWRIKHLMRKIKYFSYSSKTIEKIFKNNKFDAVVHLATFYKKKHQSLREIKQMIEANILFPSILLDLAVKNNVKYFINTGSFFEYKFNSNEKIKEDSILSPYNFYAVTKLSFENILKYYTENYSIKGLTLKLFAPYGEKDNKKLIVYIIESLIYNKVVDLTSGEQRWNFIYVGDIVKAYFKALIYISQMKKKYDVFNIGQNKAISIKKVVSSLEKISGKRLEVNWGSVPYSDKEIFYANCSNQKSKKFLNWTPSFNLEEGLRKTYLYYLNKYEKKH